MSTRQFSSQIVSRFFASLVVALIFLASPAPWRASADDFGAIGIFFAQLYDPNRLPTHLGPLVVLQVVEGSPAAKAGIHSGDLVIAINGAPVGGHEFADLLRKDIHGPVGATIRLTVMKPDGSQSELALVRTPFPPHTNPSADPFVYSVPGSWNTDSRYQFPLPFAPKLAYHGVEDVFFVPNFDYTDTPEYHSWLFFLWLDGTHMLSAEQVQTDMVTYFRGLAEERGQNYGFTPDLSYGKIITVNSEVLVSTCGTSDHTVLFFGGSLEPRNGDIWKQLDAVRDTFRCSR
jgi:hypothetical protein